jgi:lipoate---protein ligase
MRYLDLTLPTPAENLALDEALLEEAEAAAGPVETLRFWEPVQNMVVVGRSSYVDNEVHQDACRELGIPIFRRVSGGAAIVTGPGCLMYSLVLSYESRPGLRTVSLAHKSILGTLADALNSLLSTPEQPPLGARAGVQRVPGGVGVYYRGTSDLALEGKGDGSNVPERPTGCFAQIGPVPFSRLLKFSGNSMRSRRRNLLYHGTILYKFPLELISRCLKIPPRMPDYRNARDHQTFVANLPVPADAIRRALVSAWNAVEPLDDWPRELTARLAVEKYGNPQWNELL